MSLITCAGFQAVGGGGPVTYATLNSANGTGALSNGNLTVTQTGPDGRRSDISVTSGKWYWEVLVSGYPYSPPTLYLGHVGVSKIATGGGSQYVGATTFTVGVDIVDGVIRYNLGGIGSVGGGLACGGCVLGVALDVDNDTIGYYHNGSLIGSATMTGLATNVYYAAVSGEGGYLADFTMNFGASAFTYTVPSGYNPGLYTV